MSPGRRRPFQGREAFTDAEIGIPRPDQLKYMDATSRWMPHHGTGPDRIHIRAAVGAGGYRPRPETVWFGCPLMQAVRLTATKTGSDKACHYRTPAVQTT